MNRQYFDSECLQRQYELLRREAMGQPPLGSRARGLSLFLTRGMKAWIDAVSCLSGRQVTANEPVTSPVTVSSSPEVTAVLANMVLVCMQEAHA